MLDEVKSLLWWAALAEAQPVLALGLSRSAYAARHATEVAGFILGLKTYTVPEASLDR